MPTTPVLAGSAGAGASAGASTYSAKDGYVCRLRVVITQYTAHSTSHHIPQKKGLVTGSMAHGPRTVFARTGRCIRTVRRRRRRQPTRSSLPQPPGTYARARACVRLAGVGTARRAVPSGEGAGGSLHWNWVGRRIHTAKTRMYCTYFTRTLCQLHYSSTTGAKRGLGLSLSLGRLHASSFTASPRRSRDCGIREWPGFGVLARDPETADTGGTGARVLGARVTRVATCLEKQVAYERGMGSWDGMWHIGMKENPDVQTRRFGVCLVAL